MKHHEDDRDFQPAAECAGIRAFLRDQTMASDSFNTAISRHDEMLLYTLQATNGDRHASYLDYFGAGRRIVDMMRQLVDWYFGGFGNVSRYLDFASGYGRGIRYLVQELPPERVWVCDIYDHAMHFQRTMHRVNAVVSVSDPDAFPPAGLPARPGFDCITAVSFFSHVPRATFARWMTRLYAMLAPGGFLAFSVHDISMTTSEKRSGSGFVFFPNSESQSLAGEEYGTTYVSERVVREIIAEVLPPHVVVHRIPKGVSHYQDLYVVCDDPARSSARLVYHHHPLGDAHPCTTDAAGNVQFFGWAADPNPDGRIEEVRVSIDGRVVQQCAADALRPDVASVLGRYAERSGWWCQVSRDQTSPESVVLIKAINSSGLEKVLVADTMRRLVSRRGG